MFGGLKFCYNNRRAAASIMMIGVKVFEFEVNQSAYHKEGKKSDVSYGLDEIMEHTNSLKPSREGTFIRINRLLFQI